MKHSIVLGLLVATALRSSAAAATEPHTQIPFAASWEPAGIVVREAGGRPAGARGAGAVDLSWDHRAPRFTFTPAEGAPLRTDVFARIDGRRAAPVLGPAVDTSLDVGGVYRADLRDAQGAPVGWIRVSVSPFDVPSRVYDGSVPATVTPQMLAIALTRLDREIDGIEARATDVHVGS